MAPFGTGLWGTSSWGGGYVPTLPCDTGVESDMLEIMLSQFSDKPRFQAMIKNVAARVQEAECVAWDMILDMFLPNAEGVNLDLYGKIVGQDRLGLDDDEYRNLIYARIISNNSHGEIWRVIRIFWSILGGNLDPTVKVEYSPLYPAGFQLQGFVPSMPSASLINILEKWLNGAIPSGVGLYTATIAPTPFFAFGMPADPTTPELTGAQGFGENGDVTDTVNGGIIGENPMATAP